MKKISIAIDGFSSCGKSTMAKQLAKTISYIYVDTGAMYRVVTLAALRQGVMSDGDINEEKLRECLADLDITLDENAKVYLNGEDVEKDIRGLEVSNWVSKISAIGFVRVKLLDIQRGLGAQKGVVMDGRDIGSVVLPDAELKIFVTADAQVRAQRRFDELTKKGEAVTFQEILENIKMRDYNDVNRKVSPLVQAPDAFLLDNSYMSIEEQNAWLLDKVNEICQEPIIIEIDDESGFCFGVVNAIKKAEEELDEKGSLYCLGDIVHNSDECERLSKKGLVIIDHEKLSKLKNTKVLLRAHGEPPSTYNMAKSNNVEILDATCPVVLALQKRISKAWREYPGAQIVIYGKEGHAEVNGLVGQTHGQALVVEHADEIENIDFNRPIYLFSQTTKSLEGFKDLVEKIESRISKDVDFVYYDTICRQVANRMDNIRKFAREHELVIFVSGKKSSNGKVLFEECKKQNINTYFVSSADEVDINMLADKPRLIGICGATSTPKWQMQQVKDKLLTIINYV